MDGGRVEEVRKEWVKKGVKREQKGEKEYSHVCVCVCAIILAPTAHAIEELCYKIAKQLGDLTEIPPHHRETPVARPCRTVFSVAKTFARYRGHLGPSGPKLQTEFENGFPGPLGPGVQKAQKP